MAPVQLNPRNSRTDARQLVQLTILCLTLAFFAACNGNPNTNSNPTPSANSNKPTTTTTTPTEPFYDDTLAPLVLENGERPIIISGGSVDVDFNHEVTAGVPERTFWKEVDANNFICTNCEVRRYFMFNEDSMLGDDDTPFIRFTEVDGPTDIVIEATKPNDPGSPAKNIRVWEDGNNVMLTFDHATTYKKRNSSPRRHFNKKYKVTGVMINGNSNACEEGTTENVDCAKFKDNKYSMLVRVKRHS